MSHDDPLQLQGGFLVLSPTPKSGLRIVSWNTRGLLRSLPTTESARPQAHVTSLLVEADVLCLQETHGCDEDLQELRCIFLDGSSLVLSVSHETLEALPSSSTEASLHFTTRYSTLFAHVDVTVLFLMSKEIDRLTLINVHQEPLPQGGKLRETRAKVIEKSKSTISTLGFSESVPVALGLSMAQ